jgi:hypothetical protein|tara:strand:+ start:335 stop:739 length:405 start_codon:yes stop_codon:yes gene_type:complete
MKSGRPTSYNDEVLQMAKDYLNYFLDNKSEVNLIPPQVIPTAVGLCAYINIGTSTIHVWDKDEEKVEFRAVLDKIKQVQHVIALNGGMTGVYSAPIVKLLLTKHGYSDKSEQDIKSSDGSMSPPRNINDFYKED